MQIIGVKEFLICILLLEKTICQRPEDKCRIYGCADCEPYSATSTYPTPYCKSCREGFTKIEPNSNFYLPLGKILPKPLPVTCFLCPEGCTSCETNTCGSCKFFYRYDGSAVSCVFRFLELMIILLIPFLLCFCWWIIRLLTSRKENRILSSNERKKV